VTSHISVIAMRSPFCIGHHVVLCVRVVNGEDLSRYSNKIESVGLRQYPYYRYLIEKVTSTDVRITTI